MFPACCFRPRTYVVQGLFNGVLNETWTHSGFQDKWPLVGQAGLYRGRCSSSLECVYFGLLYPSLIFDMFIVVCVCVCVCVCWRWSGFGLHKEFVCVCVCVWVCILGSFVVWNLLVVLSPFLYMHTHTHTHICVCVCVCVYVMKVTDYLNESKKTICLINIFKVLYICIEQVSRTKWNS